MMEVSIDEKFKALRAQAHIRSIGWDILFTVLSCGLYNFYIQYRQIQAMNQIVGYEKYSYSKWAFLSLITCFLYHAYHEYRVTKDLGIALRSESELAPFVSLGLSLIGLSMVVDAIQQSQINEKFGSYKI